MITELFENIAAGLKTVKTCKVYMEVVPQNMCLPAFLTSIYEQRPSNGINGRKKNKIGVDVMYFPENQQESKAQKECWEVGEQMNLAFSIPDFKMQNRNLEVVDKVLHYTFSVSYRTIFGDDATRMQRMSQHTDLKEE